MGQKYVIRDFHPLVFFYVFGVAMLAVGFVLGLVELVLRIAGNAITPATIVLVAVLVIAGLQMTLFAMWFDMEAQQGRCADAARVDIGVASRPSLRALSRPGSTERTPASGLTCTK